MRQAGVNFAQVQVDDVLMGKSIGLLPAEKPFVYTTVPPYVVKRSVADADLRRQVLDAFKDGTAAFPLFWKGDGVAQHFWASVTYYHQISKFKKYVWGPEAKNYA